MTIGLKVVQSENNFGHILLNTFGLTVEVECILMFKKTQRMSADHRAVTLCVWYFCYFDFTGHIHRLQARSKISGVEGLLTKTS